MDHDLVSTIALQAWNNQVNQVQQLLTDLPDERLLQEIAPGKNRGVYLVGHLVAYHDAMAIILDLGPRLHPELDDAFLQHPDKSGLALPSITALKGYWKEVHERLASAMGLLPAEAWFSRHMAVSAEQFLLEPQRNKLGVLLNRTTHLAYHAGQLALLK